MAIHVGQLFSQRATVSLGDEADIGTPFDLVRDPERIEQPTVISMSRGYFHTGGDIIAGPVHGQQAGCYRPVVGQRDRPQGQHSVF